MNYMMQDILGVITAFILFPLLLVFPGYLISFLLNIFQFKMRRPIVKLGIASLLSASTSPILFFLAYRLVSGSFAILVAWAIAFGFIVLMLKTQDLRFLVQEFKNNKFARLGLYISLLWILIATLFLIDIQVGNRLYYNIVAYDYTTRVSVIGAITRTGVPPINPSYFPGSPQPLTQVYYFWYILCSLIDQLGGSFVDARTSLIASVIWTGLILASTIALFVRIRSVNQNSQSVWKNAFLGIGFLLISGLDIFPITFSIFFPKLLAGRFFEGDIEQWNEQITAWIGGIAWTPHHVISMLACILVWMLYASSRTGNGPRQIGVSLLAGLALASAFGLSVWLTFIFIVFWGVWFAIRLVQRESLKNLLLMILPGVFMAITLFPFLLDLFGGSPGNGTVAQFPLALNVRAFYPLEGIAASSPALEGMLIYFLALPVNYFLELGFFLFVGIVWVQNCYRNQRSKNPFAITESALLLTTAILVTFMRSTIIVNNDFGWRGWMFGQFILLVWAVDVVQWIRDQGPASTIFFFRRAVPQPKAYRLLSILAAIGAITTISDVILLRAWPPLIDTGIASFPRILTPDNHLGERTLAARQAYEYIDRNLPAEAVVQFDPRFTMDRPAGLYRTRTAAISYHTLYGVPQSVYQPAIQTIGSMFEENAADWHTLDDRCQQYHIDILIFRDLDPIWSKLDHLKIDRTPLYENQYFAVFDCNGTVISSH